MTSLALALLGAAPWVLLPPLVMLRVARSRSLANEEQASPNDAPQVSVIVPARNEAHNIERCIRSILSTRYQRTELIVIDDHSTDGTPDIARRAAGDDLRFQLLENPPLPNGWFGKQWACATGAAKASGSLLLFTDADTTHAPDLLPRAVNQLLREGSDLLSVVGRQEMHSFWERLLRPQVFWILISRYGNTDSVSRAKRAEDVIANGQFLLMRRHAYDAVGGHGSVRDKVAEDLALAQRFFREGFRVSLTRGDDQLSTHMYGSLSELIAGWGKNVFAGGIDAMPGGVAGRVLFPLVLPIAPLMTLLPAVIFILGIGGFVSVTATAWSAISTAANLLWWMLIYRGFQQRIWYALLAPVGAAVVLYIIARAIVRGRRVGWKGREYVAR
ncbi:MAG TPA: glycosyltransferase family 2 protein [Gemmatimonadaceae bacterium]|nr:glycosyltransferase family 2 protein [Gemmatimonadaceae bacterium]